MTRPFSFLWDRSAVSHRRKDLSRVLVLSYVSLAVFFVLCRGGLCLPLLQDDFSDGDITRSQGENGISWRLLSGNAEAATVDGPALGLYPGAQVLSIQRVDADEYTVVCTLFCLYGEPGKIIFLWQDERNHLYLTTGSSTFSGVGELRMVLEGNEEKLGGSSLLLVPRTGSGGQTQFKVYVKNDGKKLTVWADRDGWANGEEYEVKVELDRKEAVEKFHGGKIGFANVYAGGSTRSKPWLCVDNVVVEEGCLRTGPREKVRLWVDGDRGDDLWAGSEAQPVKTITHALTLSQPGDEIVVGPGRYGKLVFPDAAKAYGTKERILHIKAQKPGSVVVSGIQMKNAQCVVIEGFEVVEEGVVVEGEGNEIRDCLIHNLSGKTAVTLKGERHKVVGCRIQDAGFGLVVMGKGHLVERCEIGELEGPQVDCVRFFGEGHIFRRNYLAGAKGEAKGGGFRTYAAGKGDYASDILIEGNLIGSGCGVGVHVQGKANWEGRETSAEKIVVRNNVIAGCAVGIGMSQVNECVIERNTFINLGGGTGQSVSVKNCAGKVADNIFYNAIGGGTLTKTSVFGGLMEVVGNILHNEGGKEFLAEGWLENTVNRDPLLADPGSPLGADGKPFTQDDGYLLKAGSPFKGKGAQ